MDSNKIVKNAYAKYDLSLGIGLASINGKVSGTEVGSPRRRAAYRGMVVGVQL